MKKTQAKNWLAKKIPLALMAGLVLALIWAVLTPDLAAVGTTAAAATLAMLSLFHLVGMGQQWRLLREIFTS